MTVSTQGLPSTVYTVSPDALVSEVAQLMVSQEAGDVIVTEDHKPVGILTDRDIVVRVLGAGLDAPNVRVREVMSQPPVTVSRNVDVSLAIELMSRYGIRRLPIVDEERRLVSILTMDDIILLGLDGLPEVQRIIRRQLGQGEEPSAGPTVSEAQPSAQGMASRASARALSGPVAAITRPAVVVPMGRGHYDRRRRTWYQAASDWFYHNRRWIIIVILLSLAGAAAALLADFYRYAFYHYNPQYYEPKDTDRERQLLEETIRKRDERMRNQ